MTKAATPLIDKIDPVTLEKLRLRQMTLVQAAAKWGVTPTHLSRVLKEAGFRQEPSIITAGRKQAAELTQTRIEYRETLGAKVAAGTLKMDKACKDAGCSERTMWRYVAAAKAAEA